MQKGEEPHRPSRRQTGVMIPSGEAEALRVREAFLGGMLSDAGSRADQVMFMVVLSMLNSVNILWSNPVTPSKPMVDFGAARTSVFPPGLHVRPAGDDMFSLIFVEGHSVHRPSLMVS